MSDATLLRDAIGREHAPVRERPRIVSLVPSLTELLFAMDLGGCVVGRTGFCIHPEPEVREVPKLGGTKDVDLAALRALAPTHVLMNIDENERETYEAIQASVPNVIVTHPIEVEDNLALYALIGGVFGRAAQADALSRALRAELAACAQQAWPWQRVLYLIWRKPWMTVGPRTYIARMLAQVRWIAVSPDESQRYPDVDFARFGPQAFDRVLLSSEPYRFQERHAQALAQSPELGGRPVHLIDGEMTSWYGVRAIDGLRYLRGFRESCEASVPSPTEGA